MSPEELAEIRARDAAWRPRCHWMYVGLDGTPGKCGEIERMHGNFETEHTFEPPTGPDLDRRALLAHIDALEAAVRALDRVTYPHHEYRAAVLAILRGGS